MTNKLVIFGSGDMAELAKYYGIRHHIRRVSREEFLSDLPRILDAMDQPSIDGVNTWYASKAVAECGLKVVVSGVGGDELFFGYDSFRQLPRMTQSWALLAKIPGVMPLAQLAAGLKAKQTGNSRWRHAPDWARTISGAWWLRRSVNGPTNLSEKLEIAGVSGICEDFDVNERVSQMVGHLPNDSRLALGQIESMTYMRNQLLRDSDWASMDHSVELRTPLVDGLLLETIGPMLSRLGTFPNKALLAQAPEKPLPADITQRRKTGFGIPLQRWLSESSRNGELYQGWDQWMADVAANFDS